VTAKHCRILPLACLAAAGCFRLPARVCLTPPYDAPAGFSETYHAALARQEPILQPGIVPLPTDLPAGATFGPPAVSLPSSAAPAKPPMEW
jgi:hypothetical protein